MTSGLTLSFIGCGNMGSAILKGLLDATRPEQESGITPKISHFLVSTKTAASAENLRNTFGEDEPRVMFGHGQNVQAIREADVVLLACKPFLAEAILSEEGIREALEGKFVISIMAGKSPEEIENFIYSDHHPPPGIETGIRPVIVQAMPNVAARIRQSLTIIECNRDLPDNLHETLDWIFSQIGTVKYLPSELFNVGGLLAGSSMALLTVPLDGILDGCVVEGLRRGEALQMAAQVLSGMAGLLKEGEHPAMLRESISSPKGCTIQTLLTVEREGTRGTFADAIVNGTKHLTGRK
ncbi:hypothetical protein EYZ11_001359 [Aspergillus tanneri]|uniref:Delta 1-pyrroline-5-carboxylate reductase n=1 Tax=Aspergillus tanneri TaxID=1220188 RepID=A0A4S3JUU8_9EURO|nr:delta 1-pyrroline-5-carboxylate reductase [Aspergillus tanneri]KAA8650310.1 delta 1-pyrroline-5-carboxylate reductase [Aspergillus tanneri]THC99184.1 hypothetical protein EYZ11_001359 [Aspergillus tanneri]